MNSPRLNEAFSFEEMQFGLLDRNSLNFNGNYFDDRAGKITKEAGNKKNKCINKLPKKRQVMRENKGTKPKKRKLNGNKIK